MSNADIETNLNPESILHRGKLALEALHFREEAARLHAAKMDLQAALGDAENGKPERLQTWLTKNQSLLDNSVEKKNIEPHLSLPINAHAFPPPVPTALAAGDTPTFPVSKPTAQSASAAPYPIDSTLTDDNVAAIPQNAPVKNVPAQKPSPWDSMMQAALARQQASSETPVALNVSETLETKEASLLLNPLVPSPINADEPIALPEAIREVVNQKKEPQSKIKQLLWLSPALMWSTGAHLIAIVGMSVYVIAIATKTEPMAIVASPVDSETVSMEAPTEMAPTESPDLEPTSISTPNMPTVATPLASVSTSSMVLPISVAGDAPGEKPATLGSAIGDAIGSTMNAVPSTAGAQFFGVSAAGNTFCYIVDRSGSMRNGAFESAKEEIVRSLSTMKTKQRFYIFFFGEEIEGMKLDGRTEEAYPVYATPENIQKTIVWMDRVKIQSGKHPADVITRAIEMEPDGIFLLFDGETTVDLAPRVRKSNQVYDLILGDQTRVPIHSVCFYTEKPEAQKLMKTIAEQNLGTYRYVPRPPGSSVGKRKFP